MRRHAVVGVAQEARVGVLERKDRLPLVADAHELERGSARPTRGIDGTAKVVYEGEQQWRHILRLVDDDDVIRRHVASGWRIRAHSVDEALVPIAVLAKELDPGSMKRVDLEILEFPIVAPQPRL